MTAQAAEHELLGHTFPVLDTLRAVGALAVLTTHTAFWAGSYTGHGVWGTMLARLDVGVAIFFVLSGFLLSRPFLARAALGRPAPSTGRYYWKRVLRIMPLYLVTVVIALVFIDANADLGVRGWIVTFAMGNTYVEPQQPDGLTHMWSLAVEACFYIVLPLLMMLAVGRSKRLDPRRVMLLVMVMLAVPVWWLLVVSPAAGSWSTGQPARWLPAYLGWFGVGIFLALVELLHRRGVWSGLTSRVVTLSRQPGSCWAMVTGLMLVAATPIAGPSMLDAPTPSQLLTRNLLYGLVGGLLVLTGVFATPGSAFTRMMTNRAARHVGFISYGIFCLHLPVLHLVMELTGWRVFEGGLVGIWILTVAGSLFAAELAYRFVEAPCMRLKDLGRSRAASTTAASTGTSAT